MTTLYSVVTTGTRINITLPELLETVKNGNNEIFQQKVNYLH